MSPTTIICSVLSVYTLVLTNGTISVCLNTLALSFFLLSEDILTPGCSVYLIHLRNLQYVWFDVPSSVPHHRVYRLLFNYRVLKWSATIWWKLNVKPLLVSLTNKYLETMIERYPVKKCCEEKPIYYRYSADVGIVLSYIIFKVASFTEHFGALEISLYWLSSQPKIDYGFWGL